MKTVNILTFEELDELDRLRAEACGKNLLDRAAVDFAHAAHKQLGRVLEEIKEARRAVREERLVTAIHFSLADLRSGHVQSAIQRLADIYEDSPKVDGIVQIDPLIDYEAIIENAEKTADALNSEGYPGDARDIYAASKCLRLLVDTAKISHDGWNDRVKQDRDTIERLQAEIETLKRRVIPDSDGWYEIGMVWPDLHQQCELQVEGWGQVFARYCGDGNWFDQASDNSWKIEEGITKWRPIQ